MRGQPASLAQLVELLTCNQRVVGSSPTGGSYIPHRSTRRTASRTAKAVFRVFCVRGNRYSWERVCKLVGLTGAADLVSTESGNLVRAAVSKCELMTMHTAKHTFATQSLLRGIPVEVLQKVLGHQKIQTTLIYAKIVEDFQHQTMRRVWGGVSAGPAAEVSQVCAVEPLAA